MHRGWIVWLGLLLSGMMPLCTQAQQAVGRDSLPPWKKLRFEPSPPRGCARALRSALSPVRDSLSWEKARAQASTALAARGWLEAGLDSCRVAGKFLIVSLYTGRRYCYDTVLLEGLGEAEIEDAGFARLSRKHAVLNRTDFENRLSHALEDFQNEGYPFARFDSLETAFRAGAGDTIYTRFRYAFDPGPAIRIDTLLFEGDYREKESFISNLIDIHPGDPYRQDKIDQAVRVLNNSIYFKNVKPVQVIFTEDRRARLIIRMESRKAGRFDLLLGVLPPAQGTAKLQFTGLADIQLVSPIFRAGEVVQLRVDLLPNSSQKIQLQYAHPNLFGTPFRIQSDFNLLKQDTSFLNRSLKLTGLYNLSQSLALKFYYKNRVSSLLSTEAYERDSTRRPPVLDGRDAVYGLGFVFDNLDYRLNPRKGFYVSADFGLGRKRVTENPLLPRSIYNGIQLNVPKREAELRLEWYKAWRPRQVLRLANHSYWLGQAQYFENDMLQVGGSRDLRGFNENQFFTHLFCQFTLENRFILEQNSFLFVFSDFAYLENRVSDTPILRPWSAGLGMAWDTKAGILSLTYAAGQVGDFPFQPSRGRIHIGLLNQF